MPAPYLKRLWLDPARVLDREAYPFCLPFLGDDFELRFERAITIIVGENGTGKSTLLEGIAVLAGYDEAGGGKGYRPVDHSEALEKMGGELSKALRASWPKITNGSLLRLTKSGRCRSFLTIRWRSWKRRSGSDRRKWSTSLGWHRRAPSWGATKRCGRHAATLLAGLPGWL